MYSVPVATNSSDISRHTLHVSIQDTLYIVHCTTLYSVECVGAKGEVEDRLVGFTSELPVPAGHGETLNLYTCSMNVLVP